MPSASSTPPRIAAIVLAAGKSTRMGRCKSLLPLDGKPVLWHVLQMVISSGMISPVVVVTGHEPLALEPVLRQFDVERVQNKDFDAGGMISSIKAGLQVVRGRTNGVFIVLGDQPLVQPRTLEAMIRAFRSCPECGIIPRYEKKRGHPVLINADGIEQILGLTAEQTLSDYTTQHSERMFLLDVDDSSILLDLDTQADYELAAAKAAQSALRVRS